MLKIKNKLFLKLYGSKKLTHKSMGLILCLPKLIKQYLFLRRSQWWSRKDIEDYQLFQLKKLLMHAYDNVDYYHNLFESVKFNPEDLSSLQGIEKIPYLTKDLVRNNQQSLKAKNYPKETFEAATTSGSSGSPLGFYYETGKSRIEELAFELMAEKRIGRHFYDKLAVLRGYSTNSKDKALFYEKAVFGRWLVLSPYMLNESTFLDYVKKINEFNPKFIFAFPSNICRLASYMQEYNVSLKRSIKGIICSSEKLFDEQRSLLESVFKCRIYSQYGNSEKTVNAAECEYSHEYHIFPEYGIVELMDNDGNIITEPGVTGEVVTTSLLNYVFPFIRYRTGDVASYSSLPKCKCGRQYLRFESVEGRMQEYIYDKYKNKLSTTAIFGVDHSETMRRIRQYQILQTIPGKIIFKIYPTSLYSKDDENELMKIFKQNLGERLEVQIEYTDTQIPCGSNGKYKYVIQNIIDKSVAKW